MGRHDRLFKPLFQAFFEDLLHLVAPKEASSLDPARAEFLDKEAFTDMPAGQRREMDLVAKVPVDPARAARDGPKEQIVLVAVEIEGHYRSAFARRLWKYVMNLYSRYNSPVLPIVVFLKGGPAGVALRKYREKVVGFEVMCFQYYAMGLSRASAEEWLGKPEPLAAALAALMMGKTLSPAEQKLACLKEIVQAEVDDARRFLLVNTVETYLELKEHEMEQYKCLLDQEPSPEVVVMELTWAEKIEARGREAGLETGFAKGQKAGFAKGEEAGFRRGQESGLLTGAREIICRQLEDRFGKLPRRVNERLLQFEDISRLQALATRLLEAESLDELDLLSG